MTRLDDTDLALVVLLAGWTVATGAVRAPGATARTVLLLAAATAAFCLGRTAARSAHLRVAVPLTFAGGVLALIALLPGALSGGPLAPPLGYGNAGGALLVLACGAAVLAAVAATGQPLRSLCLVLAPLAAAFTLLNDSRAAFAAAVAVTLSGLLVARPQTPGRRALGLAAFAAPPLALVATVGLAVTVGATGSLERPGQTRPVLWSQALDLVRTAPVAGTGPGGFAELAPAAADVDLRRAHSLPLQQAAETGLVGLALLLALIGWVLAGLHRAARDGVAGTVGLVLAAGLLVQAAIDYTAHFPVLVLSAAGLVGLASARPD